jgi:hypothetical protein
MSKKIVRSYFADHPDAMDEVNRATYAYRLNHRDPEAHYFFGSWKEATCRWCGQSREGVRWNWYNKPPTCEARPKWASESIGTIIAKEERLFEKVLGRAKELAASIDVSTLTGSELARMHHTHGVDPSMLEVALIEIGRSLPQHLHDEYLLSYAEHRATGKRGLVRAVVVAKTLNQT